MAGQIHNAGDKTTLVGCQKPSHLRACLGCDGCRRFLDIGHDIVRLVVSDGHTSRPLSFMLSQHLLLHPTLVDPLSMVSRPIHGYL